MRRLRRLARRVIRTVSNAHARGRATEQRVEDERDINFARIVSRNQSRGMAR